ncbi:MAG: hypothetical protein ACQES2_01395 [Pseudomonadota bacterium]
MRALKLALILAMATLTSGCQLVDLFSSLQQADQHRQQENFDRAEKWYSAALNHIPDNLIFHWLEYDTRYEYGVMLNEFVCPEKPECFTVARQQFEWLLENPQVDEEPILNYWLARTYQHQAAHTEDDEEYYQSLETAFELFSEAAEGFESLGYWHDLNWTYYNLGKVADWYGDLEEAAYWLREAIKLDKEHGFEEDLVQDRAYLHDIKTRMKEQPHVSKEPEHEGDK